MTSRTFRKYEEDGADVIDVYEGSHFYWRLTAHPGDIRVRLTHRYGQTLHVPREHLSALNDMLTELANVQAAQTIVPDDEGECDG